jgi:hypothetical protein
MVVVVAIVGRCDQTGRAVLGIGDRFDIHITTSDLIDNKLEENNRLD